MKDITGKTLDAIQNAMIARIKRSQADQDRVLHDSSDVMAAARARFEKRFPAIDRTRRPAAE